MNTIVIDKKKYVLLEEKKYTQLLKKAASKTLPARKLTLAEGKKLAHSLIDKWHSAK